MIARAYNASDYRFGAFGREMDNEVKGTGNSYDFDARIFDPRVIRFLSIDPLSPQQPTLAPYHYVRNNLISRVDPDGKWDIEVHAYKDRSKYGYGIAIVKDRHGKEVYRFKVRLEGTGGRDRMVTNSDTPLGTYDIPDKNMWQTGGSRLSYGPNPRLILNPESGEIKESGRSNIRIHGGRQETYNSETKQWESVDNPELKKTHGCLRVYESDVVDLKTITDNLQKNDLLEKGGKLTIVDDLIEKNGQYSLPEKIPAPQKFNLNIESIQDPFWKKSAEIRLNEANYQPKSNYLKKIYTDEYRQNQFDKAKEIVEKYGTKETPNKK